MRSRSARVVLGLALALVAPVVPRPAAARPLYFQNLVSIYGINPGDNLYACGVCHQLWTGTGARNPFGSAVEQQLYLGKPIAAAIMAVAGDDSDGDGFTNGDELSIYHTLPGYSCANQFIAIGTPAYFQSIITPGVPSCLQPKDIRIGQTVVNFVTQEGTTAASDVQIFNNGSDFPITVSAYGLLPGAHAALSVSGPGTPVVIPVGQSATVTVHFAPPSPIFAAATLRITSDDPDQPDLDLAVTGIGFANPLASAADRAACLGDVEHQVERYTKVHLKAWSACFGAELAGVGCNAGGRDLKIGQAEAKLRAAIGGAKDRFCAPKSLTPVRLGLPSTCGGACSAITLQNLTDVADCLVCRQSAATDAMLQAAVGATPPDLPGNVLSGAALGCNKGILSGMRGAVGKSQKALGACRVGAITVPVDCTASVGPVLSDQAARVDAWSDHCADTTGMQGCLFLPSPDPMCLGTATTSIATDLADAVFGP